MVMRSFCNREKKWIFLPRETFVFFYVFTFCVYDAQQVRKDFENKNVIAFDQLHKRRATTIYYSRSGWFSLF